LVIVDSVVSYPAPGAKQKRAEGRHAFLAQQQAARELASLAPCDEDVVELFLLTSSLFEIVGVALLVLQVD
jgi:hypothetical protein